MPSSLNLCKRTHIRVLTLISTVTLLREHLITDFSKAFLTRHFKYFNLKTFTMGDKLYVTLYLNSFHPHLKYNLLRLFYNTLLHLNVN